MAEQLLGFGRINEGYLTAMNMKEARKDVATSLISNSGFIYSCICIESNVMIYSYKMKRYVAKLLSIYNSKYCKLIFLCSEYVESLSAVWEVR